MLVLRHGPTDVPLPCADIAVVIDVLRMTSTAATLMRRPSCTQVAVAATLDDLAHLAPVASESDAMERVIVSELVEASRLGTRIDNSPAQVSRMDFANRAPVLVTTNGTKTLLAAAACAQRVLLASFIDVHAVAQHITATSATRVLLLPAGNVASGQGRIEDDLCADTLEALLGGLEPDLGATVATIRADPRVLHRCGAEAGFSADLELALQCDQNAMVLEFLASDRGVGSIVPAQ